LKFGAFGFIPPPSTTVNDTVKICSYIMYYTYGNSEE